ncbi:BTB/POZ domain-containing protein At3g05675 isoform X1 [Dendrobium catenatum]|uniref:BTB/POZ domain-containing protein n=2 Tax=Dendrobium catenatum TaxID=906689 RepID=A0A2I0W117_9ASPA|nr:BTB/POZ domain-containing protein At3g05675 isoform X1 [Dendrobium catenatum]XP_020697040.1 BTB/POZ domain-containing protein At3g05675 isoform X1 [Dendrobium catenatum]XP_020697048.1 BTB/POZ domain-containing protein At3g05675 isoform X1 [Dendrobium catenatum]XP_020697054.1 BTB/POZ domain-containing protein At3g05675 isoform X1 [Dendrobium catenatum]XP_028554933.1 BTB/POZ domain-containing protein At3g05675 isoform X1 [Dendrobium catenatum]XP_028554934.1 BTB/POZ domain-containing protein A
MVALAFGDRATSDTVVRLRTHEGRDDWFYCHSKVLVEKSKYFAERLSDDWPTCQIIDSRNCVEVYCQELDFNFHVTALRLLYVKGPHKCYGVRNALGMLQVSIHLGCHQIASDCKEYLEAVPWEEAEEEEILKTIPNLGEQYKSILSRLQPVCQTSLTGIFISAIRFATSSPPISMRELKSSAQEQLEYMLTEDDDPPLFALDDEFIRSVVKDCIKRLLCRFDSFVESMLTVSIDCVLESKVHEFWSHLCDISWACQILGKMEIMKDLVHYWLEASANILRAAEHAKSVSDDMDVEIKIVEVVSKVLETIGFGNAIVSTLGRISLVKIWLPFVQRVRALLEQDKIMREEDSPAKLDGEIWQGLESAFVSIILTLPSSDQAGILSDWLRSEYAGYPDLTEAFELWCYRTKVARRRLASREVT